jgi:hypothetical protein
MYHNSIALALAEAHVADLQRTAALRRSTVSSRVRDCHRLRALALALAAIAALAPAGALAQPARDVAIPADEPAEAVRCDPRPRATSQTTRFANPLGRSRGPGAGAGLL